MIVKRIILWCITLLFLPIAFVIFVVIKMGDGIKILDAIVRGIEEDLRTK